MCLIAYNFSWNYGRLRSQGNPVWCSEYDIDEFTRSRDHYVPVLSPEDLLGRKPTVETKVTLHATIKPDIQSYT